MKNYKCKVQSFQGVLSGRSFLSKFHFENVSWGPQRPKLCCNFSGGIFWSVNCISDLSFDSVATCFRLWWVVFFLGWYNQLIFIPNVVCKENNQNHRAPCIFVLFFHLNTSDTNSFSFDIWATCVFEAYISTVLNRIVSPLQFLIFLSKTTQVLCVKVHKQRKVMHFIAIQSTINWDQCFGLVLMSFELSFASSSGTK